MSVGWESLPLLPLQGILQHLSVKDALAAMSVCRHWRSATLVYEGNREQLILRAKQTDRNFFLARLFRKKLQKLHVYIDCKDDELDKFFNIVLPEFFDSTKLREILFIGPSYLQQNHNLPPAKLRRIVTESLIFKNSHCIVKFGVFGCDIDLAVDNDRYMNEQIEYFSTPLSFNDTMLPQDRLLSSTNINHMMYSTLQQISVDYDLISTEALETLSNLPMFQHLSLTISNKTKRLVPLDWNRLRPLYPNELNVSLNIVKFRRFNDIIQNVLVPGLQLISLKVLFCKTMYYPLLNHIVQQHQFTLRELVWADSPSDGLESYRMVHTGEDTGMTSCDVNPFILICWQCANLRRLVIHGYWVWQYDVLGFARLRKTLQQLEISAVYSKQGQFGNNGDYNTNCAIRVLSTDVEGKLNDACVINMNEYGSRAWSPLRWVSLPRGLQRGAGPVHTADYVIHELAAPVPDKINRNYL